MSPGELQQRRNPFEVHASAAALYVALLKNGYLDEATEFAEWYLDTFDHDLED
jgi:hypothetical protein